MGERKRTKGGTTKAQRGTEVFEGECAHIHLSHHNECILLLVIVVNLLACLIIN